MILCRDASLLVLLTLILAGAIEMYHRKSSRAMQRHSKSNGTTKTSGSSKGDKKEPADGFDHEEMGMTQERQRVIQASLFKMLGQADSAPGPAESAKTTEATTATSGVSKSSTSS